VAVFWHVKWHFWHWYLKLEINLSFTVMYVSGQLANSLLGFSFFVKNSPIELKIFLQHLQTILYNFCYRSLGVRCLVSKIVWGWKFLMENNIQMTPTPSKIEIIDHSQLRNPTHNSWKAGVKGLSSRWIFSYFCNHAKLRTNPGIRRTNPFYIGKRYLKELTEGHHQEWSLWLNLTQHGKSHQARTPEGLTDW